MVSKAKKETEVAALKREIANLTKIVKDMNKDINKLDNRIFTSEQTVESYNYKFKALQVSQGDIWDNIEEIEGKINAKRSSKSQNNSNG